MAQSIGIHLGERRFALVALEGSLKKHKVTVQVAGEIPADGPEALAEELRRIAKEHQLKPESVSLAIDSGLAAFRNLTLPFDDRAKIEEVLKFEVESDLPHWEIDQVIVDFLMLSSKPGVESNLLVTAIPKDRLRARLEACERAGLEALEAELEGTALFDAAYEAGVLAPDTAALLVHVGDASTTVVIADGRRLAGVRAIRAGALPPRAKPAAEPAPEGEAPDEPAEAAGGDDPASALQRAEESAARVKREIGRTLSGVQTTNEIGAIYLCGHPLPGLAQATLFDLPVSQLQILPGGAEGQGEFVVAYGAALRGMGGGALHPRLRREELRFTGKFERIELPLAVFSLLLFTLLFVQFIVLDKQIDWRDEGDIAKQQYGDMQLWLMASNGYMLPDADRDPPYAGRLTKVPDTVLNFAKAAERGDFEDLTKYQEIARIKKLLGDEIVKMEKSLGQATDVQQPQSALEATTLVVKVLEGLDKTARIGVRGLDADYTFSRGNREDYVLVKMDMDFFAEDSRDATRQYNAMENAFNAMPWCEEFKKSPSKVHDDGKGISVDALSIQVNVAKAHVPGKREKADEEDAGDEGEKEARKEAEETAEEGQEG